ncbi:MAG: dTDP-4-dehydrorhamnose reductase [Candidatus Bathyarchaeota archaeon]|nr:MAG: dTDP-4-dehydrorhamnose reductase [Candidatus Bathyarchaeota archaeon]
MAKILITGTSGLLGNKITLEAKRRHIVYPTHATHPSSSRSLKMDITNENEVKQVFYKIKPEVVIHTAAETNVDKCSKDKKHAFAVNSEGTKNLAKVCNQIDARIVYISTDYVFDGEKGLYKEEDNTNPLNFYGFTKLMGEKHILEICKRYLILRTSVLYGFYHEKPNFAMWVITALKDKKPFHVVEDHYNSPTLASNLAEVTLEMVDKELDGLYHAAGSERISRYSFALRIAETFEFNTDLIKPVKMHELKAWVAKRPKDSSLCVNKVKKQIDTTLLHVSQGLKKMKMKLANLK